MLCDVHHVTGAAWQSQFPEYQELLPGWEQRVSPELRKRTEPFLLLYREVTETFAGYARSNNWPAEDALFLDYLMAGFCDAYLLWDAAGSGTDAYLKIFEKPLWKAAEAIGGAYLHVAYDLPGVIANGLDNAYFASTPTRRKLIEDFLVLQDPLKEVLNGVGGRSDIFGHPAAFLRWFKWRSQFLGVLGNWMLILRSNAYLRAQTLVGLSDAERANEARWLLDAVRSAAEEVMEEHAWNPLMWFSRLPSWVGLAPFLFFFAQTTVGVTRLTSLETLLITLATLAVMFVAYAWAVDALLARLAEDLGRAILHASSNPGTDTSAPQRQPMFA